MKTKLLSIVCALSIGAFAQAQSLEQRVEALEMNSLLNSMKFSGTLWTQFDSIENKDNDANTESTLDLYRMKFNLDVAAEMNKKFQFYGRIAASKLLNETNSKQEGTFDNDFEADLSGSTQYAGSQLYLERAYANIGLTDSLTFSFGRLPTIDGAPTHFYNDMPRQGTYPKMAYSAILDGFALTYNHSISDTQKLALRALYTPFSSAYRSGTASFNQPERVDSDTEIKSVTNTYTFMADYNQTNISWTNAFNAIVQYVNVHDLEIDDSLIAASTYAPSTLHLDYTYVNLYLEALNLMNSNLDIAISHTMTTLDNTKGAIDLSAAATLPAGSIMRGLYCDGTACGEVDGQATLLALKYKINSAMLNNPSLGLEYLMSDEGYFFSDYSNEDILNFYGTVGKGMHVYYTQPINTYAKASIGMMKQEVEYGNDFGILGKRAEVDVENTTLYARIRADF